jgi:hypothetical protein
MTDGAGVPLACLVSAANRHDVTALLAVVLAIPRTSGRRESLRPRQLGTVDVARHSAERLRFRATDPSRIARSVERAADRTPAGMRKRIKALQVLGK